MRTDRRITEKTSPTLLISFLLALVALGLAGFSLYLQLGPTASTLEILSDSDQAQRQQLSDAIRILDTRIKELEARQLVQAAEPPAPEDDPETVVPEAAAP